MKRRRFLGLVPAALAGLVALPGRMFEAGAWSDVGREAGPSVGPVTVSDLDEVLRDSYVPVLQAKYRQETSILALFDEVSGFGDAARAVFPLSEGV